MWTALLNILTGGLLDKVLGYFQQREAARLNAMSTDQRHAHELKMAARQDAKEIRLATAGFWEMRVITVLIAAPFVVHLWLVGIDTNWPQPWDVAKWPAPFDEWEGAILLSFFGVAGAVGVGRAVAGSIALRRK
jgi:hypothetical protein